MKKIIISLTCMLYSIVGRAQSDRYTIERIPKDFFEKKWEGFHYNSKGDIGGLRRYFRDTVSVEEMKEAFRNNHNKHLKTSPYASLDSIVYGFHGKNALLNSPLRDHPLKKLRDKRGVWRWGLRFYLHQLLDGNGMPVEDNLLKKAIKDTIPFMDRDYVTLRSPRHYMGFVVSPIPHIDTFNRSRRTGTGGFAYRQADFFSSASPGRVLDGEWYHDIKSGARFMGQVLGLYYAPEDKTPERTFSVLLYEKPKEKGISVAEYTIELLLPEEPDEATREAFKRMKDFVEELRFHSFNPLYTSDMRIMTGRFYRVTVNKCGWFVEDYMDINN